MTDERTVVCEKLGTRYVVKNEDGTTTELPSLLRQLVEARRLGRGGVAEKVSGTKAPPIPLGVAAADLLNRITAGIVSCEVVARETLHFSSSKTSLGAFAPGTARQAAAVGSALKYLPGFVEQLYEVGERDVALRIESLLATWARAAETFLGLAESDVCLRRTCYVCPAENPDQAPGTLFRRVNEWGQWEVYCSNVDCRDEATGRRTRWTEHELRIMEAQWAAQQEEAS